MKKDNHPVDDFFRKSLHDHTVTPSAKAKQAFLEEASGIKGIRRNSRVWYYIGIPAVILFIAGAALLTGLSRHSVESIPSTVAATEQPGRMASSEMTSTEIQDRPKVPVKNDDHTSSTRDLSAPGKISLQKKQHADPGAVIKTIPLSSRTTNSEPDPPVDLTETPESHIAAISPGRKEKFSPEKPMALIDFTGFLLTGEIEDPEQYTVMTGPGDHRQKREPGLSFSTGLYYAPEWMYNTPDGTRFVNNAGIEQTIRYRRYTLRTGLGLSVTKGTSDLRISYNDYLGSFQKLDSMTFVWNQEHTDLIPTYYLSDQEVWDSLMKLENAKVVKRYTYLQVPLIMGYDFIATERFYAGIRLGPVLSFLLKSEQISESYDPGRNKVIMINQITPERIRTNWQLMAGIDMGFRISRSFSIELEPEARYYFNSVYEQSDATKKPWSLGFRAAFQFCY